jgi:methionyl-tRNA formyltransferase
MRIVFMGTAELACPSLQAVAAMPEHQIVAVFTQPNRPKGRSLKITAPPVKVFADRLGLPVHQPVKAREPATVGLLKSLKPDLIIVVAYGQILPPAILQIPPRGCVNVHASLLPRWRGASPIQYAILAGDSETGVTTMFMDEQMDTGDIILQRREPIRPGDNTGTLHDRLASLGAELLVETVRQIATGAARRTKQDNALATYAKKLSKEDGRVDWTNPAELIERQIRACNPWPGAFAILGDTMLKLWRAEAYPTNPLPPGQIHGDRVGTGQGALRLLEVQPAGGKRMSFTAFLRGHPATSLR